MEKRSGMFEGLVLAAVMLCLAGPWSRLAAAQDEEPVEQPVQGQLKVLGEHVERLVLSRLATPERNLLSGDENTLSGDALTRGVSLKPGTYLVRELTLKGGYRCVIWKTETLERIKVEAGGVTELKTGAPLTQGLTVERKGKMFRLGYELKGIGGETYTATDFSVRPEFAVYKGDRKVGGGRFEYG